jgi:hypothetical protein
MSALQTAWRPTQIPGTRQRKALRRQAIVPHKRSWNDGIGTKQARFTTDLDRATPQVTSATTHRCQLVERPTNSAELGLRSPSDQDRFRTDGVSARSRVQQLSFIKGFEQEGNCIWLLGDRTANQVGASANEYGGKSTSTTFQTLAHSDSAHFRQTDVHNHACVRTRDRACEEFSRCGKRFDLETGGRDERPQRAADGRIVVHYQRNCWASRFGCRCSAESRLLGPVPSHLPRKRGFPREISRLSQFGLRLLTIPHTLSLRS